MTEVNQINETLMELAKLVELLDEDVSNLKLQDAVSDYIVPILLSTLAEIEANRQIVVGSVEKTNLALLMSEKTFLGDILVSLAENFTVVANHLEGQELPEEVSTAIAESQDLLATWMSFEDDDEDDEEDAEEVEESVNEDVIENDTDSSDSNDVSDSSQSEEETATEGEEA